MLVVLGGCWWKCGRKGASLVCVRAGRLLLLVVVVVLLLLSLAESSIDQAANFHHMCVLQSQLFLHFKEPELVIAVLLVLAVCRCT